MAGGITGRLSADFSSFNAAVQQAQVQLKGFEAGGAKVVTQLTAVGNSLSGTRVIQQAQLMTEAIARMGGEGGVAAGLLKLTDAELQKVATTTQQATEKMQAMGTAVPADLKKVADGAAAAQKETTSFSNSLQSVAGTLGVAFSVGAVVQFAKAVVETGAKIEETSQRLGISTDAVQGFKFAAEQSGSSLEAVTTAITKMEKNVDEGSRAVVDDLKKLGLSFKDVREATPEEAFLKITDAIKKIPDPMEQSEIALKLFGKGAGELLPAIKTGFREVSDSADKMSQQTVKDLKDAEDAWRKFGNTVTVVTGTVLDKSGKALGTMAAGVKEVTSSSASFAGFADNVIKYGVGAAIAMAGATKQATDAAKDFAKTGKDAKDVVLPLAAAHHKTAEELAAEAEELKKLNEAYKKFSGGELAVQVKQLEFAFQKMNQQGKLSETQFKLVSDEAAKLQAHGAVLSPQLRVLAEVHGLVAAETDRLKISQEELNKTFEKSQIQAGARIFELAHTLAVFQQAGAGATFITNKTLSLPPIDTTAVRASAQHALDALNAATFNDIEGRMKHLGVSTSAVLGQVATLSEQNFSDMAKSGIFTADELDRAWDKMTKDMIASGHGLSIEFKNDLIRIGEVVTTTFATGGDVGRAALGGATALGANVSKNLLSGAAKDLSKSSPLLGHALGEMAGPLGGAAVSLGLALGKKLWNSLFGTAGRDAVTTFANSLGGFDALQKKLAPLGDAGATLWKNLTQGVGRNNPQQAQAAIDAVNKALGDQATKISDIQTQIDALGGSGVPTMDAIKNAAQTLGISTDKLGQSFQNATAAANWQQVIDSMDVLVRSGEDVGNVVELSKDKLNSMYQDALKFGTTLPANSQKWLDQLASEGELFDANGKKISQSEVDGMSFGDTMQTTLEKLNATLKQLIGTIAGPGNSLSGALETVGNKIVSPHIKPVIDWPDTTPPGSPANGGPQAAGGDYYVTKPTRFLAGEAGPERVSFSGASRADMAGGGSGSITVQLILQDGRMLAELVVPHIPTVVNELGLNRP